MLKVSFKVGDDWITGMLPCTGWSIKATEIFSWPFGGDTTTPILFVSNTYDPVAPIEKYATYTLLPSALSPSLTDHGYPQWAFLRVEIYERAASYH